MKERGVSLPAVQGNYVLIFRLEEERWVAVGKLGNHCFPAGIYFYAGSALGKGGLRARLSRHLKSREDKKLFWHIDYLLSVARVQAVAFLCTPRAASPSKVHPQLAIECLFSTLLLKLPQANIPLKGFGASDCRFGCPAHLIHFPIEPQATFSEDAMRHIIEWLSMQAGEELHFYWMTPSATSHPR